MMLESIYENESVCHGVGADFSHADPVDVFSRMRVYAEFDSDRAGRRLVTRRMPGQPGVWVLTYSVLERLHRACGDDDIEYSSLAGRALLEVLPEHAGVWFDQSFPGGRAILMPPPEPVVQPD